MHKELEDLKGTKVSPEQVDIQVLKDNRVLMVQIVQQVLEELKVLKDKEDHRVLKVF